MTFRVGQKVVCVDDEPDVRWPRWNGDAPVRGAIYTIADVGLIFPPSGQECVALVEIKNNARGYFNGYYAARFRPLVDISDLTELVAEVFQGKKREIPADKFDRVHSSAHALGLSDAGAPPPAAAGEDATRGGASPAPISTKSGEIRRAEIPDAGAGSSRQLMSLLKLSAEALQ